MKTTSVPAGGVLLGLLALACLPSPLPAAEPKFLLAWGQKGDGAGEFHSSVHVAVTAKDEVYVADLNNARVQKFDSAGKHLGDFDLPRDDPRKKSAIVGGMAVDAEGQVYLSFMNQHRVGVYTGEGKLVREWGKKGSGGGEFNQPGGIVLRADGTAIVADQCNHRVQVFDAGGKFLSQWGGYGAEPGQFGAPAPAGSRFGGPHFLARDSKGRLYTTEGIAGRVQQFSAEGKPLSAWGSKEDKPGGFGALDANIMKLTFGPVGVAVDRHDRVWVTSLNDRVQAFTPEGKFLFGVGGTGKEPGQFARPHGMAFDSKGRLYVADAGNQRVQKFEVPAP